MYHVATSFIDEQWGLGRCSPSPVKDKTPAVTCVKGVANMLKGFFPLCVVPCESFLLNRRYFDFTLKGNFCIFKPPGPIFTCFDVWSIHTFQKFLNWSSRSRLQSNCDCQTHIHWKFLFFGTDHLEVAILSVWQYYENNSDGERPVC